MLIKVPFVYPASIIPAKCRKPRVQYIRDVAGATIADLGEAKLAASWKAKRRYTEETYEYQVFHCHGSFWEQLTHSPAVRVPDHAVTLEEWLERISDPRAYGNPFGGHALASTRQAQSSLESLPTRDMVKNDMGIREYLGDDRGVEEKAIFETGLCFGVRDGLMYVKRDEPVYRIMTFGLGCNHGSTALMVDGEISSHDRDGRFFFNLTDLDKAVQAATRIAESRQDTRSLPIKPAIAATIHAPEVFSFAPYSHPRFDAGDISLYDFAMARIMDANRHSLETLVRRVSAQIADRIIEAGTEEQVAWLTEQDIEPATLLSCFSKSEPS